MDRLPVVRLPDHHARTGKLLAWRLMPNGKWEALVEYDDDVPGARGDVRAWFPEARVEQIEDEDYRRVPKSRFDPDQPSP